MPEQEFAVVHVVFRATGAVQPGADDWSPTKRRSRRLLVEPEVRTGEASGSPARSPLPAVVATVAAVAAAALALALC